MRKYIVDRTEGNVPVKWVKDGEFETIGDATSRAKELAGGNNCYTEPREGIPHGYFGKKDEMDKPWNARIRIETN